MARQRISYVPLEKMDADMRREMERCQREGTPRPESTAVRAHVPAAFWFFANAWRDLFQGKGKTHDALAAAEKLLSNLSGESPLHLRLATELEELKKGPPVPTKKRVAAPRKK